MIPVLATSSARLTWSQIPHTHNYELRANAEKVAILHHLRGLSPHFIAETQHGRWIFRRNGFLGAGSEILDADSQQQTATFKAVWSGGGVLTFSDGQIFHLECKGLWRPVWTITSQDGEPVLRLHSREKYVELMAARLSDSRMFLLVLFTWYRVLQGQEDAAAAAMIAS
jgi:hypothetical protein